MVRDHLGNEYQNLEVMCKHYGIARSVYSDRIKNQGLSVEQALTLERKSLYKGTISSVEDRTDHLGNVYNTREEMCKHYGKTREIVNKRLKKGYTLERALTERSKKDSITDPFGITHKNYEEMCSYYGKSRSAVDKRLEKGKTLEEALTESVEKRKPSKDERTDHNGKVFKSIKEMCEYWEISKDLYDALKSKYSKESILEKTYGCADVTLRTDVFGKTYKSIRAMCREYGVSVDYYRDSLDSGRPKEVSLGICPHLSKVVKNLSIGNYLVVRFEFFPDGQEWDNSIDNRRYVESMTYYFLCIDKRSGEELFLTDKELLEESKRFYLQNKKETADEK